MEIGSQGSVGAYLKKFFAVIIFRLGGRAGGVVRMTG